MGVSETMPRYGVPARRELWDSIDRLLNQWAGERPDLDFTPVGVVTRMLRVRGHLEAGLIEVFRRFDLTGADFAAIVTLRRAGHPYRMTRAGLTSELALTAAAVDVQVDRLTERDLVVLEPDHGDPAAEHLRLTEAGLALFDEIAPVHLANEDRLLSALTEEERAHLADLLRRLLVSFESGTGAAGEPWGMRLEPGHVARSRRAALGLSDATGLLVADVVPGSPAAAAGLRSGDLVVAVNDHEVRSDATLTVLVDLAGPGARMRVAILRGDDALTLTLRIAPGIEQ